MPGPSQEKSRVTRSLQIDVRGHRRPFTATPSGSDRTIHINRTMDDSQRRLSRAALLEHNEYHSPRGSLSNAGQTITVTAPSKGSRSDQMTEENSDNSPNSLGGTDLSSKAFNVTRRLSKSVYLLAAFENLRLKQGRLKKDGSMALQNTYKLQADEGEHFKAEETKEVIQNVLNKFLRSRAYDPKESGELCCQLSSVIKNRVKDLDMPRYKIVSNVILSERKGQAVEMASRCLWDQHRDNYAFATFENDSLCAVATVHGVYFE